MTKNEKICDQCLAEMFKRVGLEYPNEELTRHEDWYARHTWTEDEEKEFEAWMLKKLKKARMIRPEMEVAMFMLMWGWRTKEEA